MFACGSAIDKTVASRRAAEQAGRCAEQDVASMLRDQGYTVLAERLRTGVGEIDLVVADASTIVFVEVKARKSYSEAVYAISPRQQVRLLEAASVALGAHPGWLRENTRFDAVLVTPARTIHLRDAIRYH